VPTWPFSARSFARICQVRVSVPPLRERREDIVPLADALCAELQRELGIPVGGLSQKALCVVQAHHWPGNVAELRNVIAQALLDEPTSVVQAESIQRALGSQQAAPLSLKDRTKRFERDALVELYRQNGKNVLRTARAAGCDPHTVRSMLQKAGVHPKPKHRAADRG
jgi:DNA-binding NtrC family response regulator